MPLCRNDESMSARSSRPLRASLALLAATLLVAACGGGGGQSAPVVTPGAGETPGPVAPAPTEPAPTPEPEAEIAEAIDLRHWRVTVPADSNGSTYGTATTISAAQLTAAPPYESTWFYKAADDALTFWVPVNGAISGSSSYPRSELREMMEPGNAAVNWSSWQDAELRARCAVQQVPPSTGRVTIGQVHGYKSPLPLFMLQYVHSGNAGGGSVETVINPSPNATASQRLKKTLIKGIALGERFDYRIAVKAGVLHVEVNGQTLDYTIGTAWSGVGHYFKAGAYIPESGSSSADGAKVAFYRLLAIHR